MRLISKGSMRLAAVAVAAVLGGCGWSARDQFYANRSVTLRSRPGDGTEISSQFRAAPGTRTAGVETASRWER